MITYVDDEPELAYTGQTAWFRRGLLMLFGGLGLVALTRLPMVGRLRTGTTTLP